MLIPKKQDAAHISLSSNYSGATVNVDCIQAVTGTAGGNNHLLTASKGELT